MEFYKEKENTYFSGIRHDMISLVPKNTEKLLEVGAGGGDTLVYLKQNMLIKEAVGIELFDIPNSQQKNILIDKLLIGNIEEMEIALPTDYFDVILCGDVLEHLFDPWAVVAKLEKHLKKGGLFIISCPNIREIGTLYKIIFKADFTYQESGILDKTHIRFFCKKNLLEMMTTPKLVPTACYPSFVKDGGYGVKRRKFFNNLSLGLLKDFLAVQFLIISQKK